MSTLAPSGLAAVFACGLLIACSSQQTYATGQTWQRNECNKIIDMQERQRCVAKANESYETYQKQVDDIKKPTRPE